jgi:hypothetical protein
MPVPARVDPLSTVEPPETLPAARRGGGRADPVAFGLGLFAAGAGDGPSIQGAHVSGWRAAGAVPTG